MPAPAYVIANPEENPVYPVADPNKLPAFSDPINAVPEMLPADTNEPVDGFIVNLVEDTFCGKLPDVAVTHVGYTVAFVAVSSVMAVFVALVAVVALVADVAVVALPDNAPENVVAVTVPVDGLKVNLVEETFCGRLPVVVVTHVGYTVAFVVVSSVIAVFVALVAVPDVAAFKFATCVVEATANGAVPVATVLVS